jgi:hypothetical protein
MTRQRNVRDRQLRRWALRTTAVDRRNGVWPDGYDPRHVNQILPWCVEAYLARGPIRPRMSTRGYRELEWESLQPRQRITP